MPCSFLSVAECVKFERTASDHEVAYARQARSVTNRL
jgi:hypothetical protein